MSLRTRTLIAIVALVMLSGAGLAFDRPTVRDAASAIRIARAMLIASSGPGDPAALYEKTEREWLARCEAKLVNGVWVVTNKERWIPRRTAPFMGAESIRIGAKDGRLISILFLD